MRIGWTAGILGGALAGALLCGGCPNTTPTGPDTGDPNSDNSTGAGATPATIKADAGDAQTVRSGERVFLTGAASTPGRGTRLTYYWQQIGGPEPVDVSGAFSTNPQFTAPANLSAPTDFIFRITVNDGFATASADVAVTVVPAS